MQCALHEADEASLAGEVPVGALLLSPQGEILGAGHNRTLQACDISAHAEIVALRRAGERTRMVRFPGAVLVVTLEPCAMCAAAIVQARLAGVVFGCFDALAGAVCSRTEYLDAPCNTGKPVWHMGGILAEACARILQDFFARCRHGEQA